MANPTIIEIIKRRSSWRSYNSKIPIPKDVLNQLKEYIDSELQSGPFGNRARFRIIKIPDTEKGKLNSEYGTYGFIKGAEYFVAGAIFRKVGALEDFGYLMEKIILKATELNLGTCWLAGTFKRSTFSRNLIIQSDEILPAITPIGIPTENERPVGKLIRFVIRAKNRKLWSDLFFTEAFHALDPQNVDEPIRTALEMVRLAPSAKNKQPWRIVIDQKNLVHFFIENSMDHILNYQKLDIGIAMCHFELTLRSFNKIGAWNTSDPQFSFDRRKYHYVCSWI